MTTETCKRELAIEVPAEEAERELKTLTAQYARVARIPGFRPGHAPSSLVLRRFRKDIRNDVVQALLPKFFDQAVKEREWLVVGQPRFEDLKFDEALPLTCKAVFEVYPEFELNSYQGLEVEEDPVEVTDADVDRTLEALRQAEAATQQKLVDKLLTAHEFPVPEILVEAQLDRKLERTVGQLVAQGIDPRTAELDWRKLREESRPAAEKEVRAGLILDKVAEAEKIEVSEEEVDEMIRQMAQERQEPPAALKTRLTRDGEMDRIKTSRRSQKVLEVIYRSAKITRKSEAGPAPVEK